MLTWKLGLLGAALGAACLISTPAPAQRVETVRPNARTAINTPVPAQRVETVRPNARTAAGSEQTPQELQRLPPMQWHQPRQAPVPYSALSTEQGSTAAPGNAPGGSPNTRADEVARREFPKAWREHDLQRQSFDGTDFEIDFGTANTYTAYAANGGNDRTISPQKAIGLLTNDRGSCSASVISRRNIIVTAAHCCYTRGQGWRTNFRFYPAYRSGQHPTYGSFPWSQASILNSWITRGARQDDVCLIRLGNNNNAKPVTFYTGWLGRQWNASSVRNLHALGYPGNIGGGNSMQLCTAETFSPSSTCGGTTVLNMGCNMTHGSSGGPWISSYRSGNFVNSVVSGYDNTTCTGTLGQTFNGPRFTSANIVPLCTHIGGC